MTDLVYIFNTNGKLQLQYHVTVRLDVHHMDQVN